MNLFCEFFRLEVLAAIPCNEMDTTGCELLMRIRELLCG